MPDLVVDKLSKQFPTPSTPLIILDEITVSLSAGENMVVVGPSGSGKSTFLHIVGTLDAPSSGRVELQGIDPFELSANKLARFRNENIGFIFQEHHLLPQLTALENVLVPVLARNHANRDISRRAEQLLENVGLAERIHHRPAQLSGGERQRVAVARALIHRPSLLLADEPTGSLDRQASEMVGELLLKLQQQESTMLICVTHNSTLASRFQTRYLLQDGKFHTQT